MTTPDSFSHWIHSMGANTPTRGWRRRWTSLYGLHTADTPDVARIGDFLFLWDLQEKQESRQADSNRLPLLQLRVIRNPVVEYTYAKEDRVVASCDYRRVGEPLQESEGPRRTLAPSDRVAAERGDEDRGGLGGHWIQPGLGAQNSPPLQRVGRGCSWRSSSFQSGCQAEGSLGRVRRRGVA